MPSITQPQEVLTNLSPATPKGPSLNSLRDRFLSEAAPKPKIESTNNQSNSLTSADFRLPSQNYSSAFTNKATGVGNLNSILPPSIDGIKANNILPYPKPVAQYIPPQIPQIPASAPKANDIVPFKPTTAKPTEANNSAPKPGKTEQNPTLKIEMPVPRKIFLFGSGEVKKELVGQMQNFANGARNTTSN